MSARKQIIIRNSLEASKFSRQMQEFKTKDTFVLENKSGEDSVNPASYLGVLYMATFWTNEIFLTNLTSDTFPDFIDKFDGLADN